MWSTGSTVEGWRMCAFELQLLFFSGMTACSRLVETVLIIRFVMRERGGVVERYQKSLRNVSKPLESRGAVIAATDPWHCPASIDLTSTLHRSYHISISSKRIKSIGLNHQNSFQRVYGAPAFHIDASQLRLPAPGSKHPRCRDFQWVILKMSFIMR